MALQAQPEECFCCVAGSTAQLLQAACMEAELFSSSPQQLLGNGISEFYILFMGNRTGVFRTGRCSAFLPVKSMGPPITVVKTVSALFTSCLRGSLGNGTGE